MLVWGFLWGLQLTSVGVLRQPWALSISPLRQIHLTAVLRFWRSAAKSSRGYRTTTQDRELRSAYRCPEGQTTCVKCGRRSARRHAYAHPKGLTRRVFFRRGWVAYR